jgi:hypothetical protein
VIVETLRQGRALFDLSDPDRDDGVMIIAVAKPDEARHAVIADAPPVAPIGQRHVQGILFVVAPPPRFLEQALQRRFVRIVRVAARLFAIHRRRGRRYPGRLPRCDRMAAGQECERQEGKGSNAQRSRV